jgi:hypothetical protein
MYKFLSNILYHLQDYNPEERNPHSRFHEELKSHRAACLACLYVLVSEIFNDWLENTEGQNEALCQQQVLTQRFQYVSWSTRQV